MPALSVSNVVDVAAAYDVVMADDGDGNASDCAGCHCCSLCVAVVAVVVKSKKKMYFIVRHKQQQMNGCLVACRMVMAGPRFEYASNYGGF